MDPFDWKNNPAWILLTLPGLIAVFFGIGLSLGHSLLSGIISIAVILLLLFLYIKRKSKKAKGES
jgi:Flp pilus assembly protein TadB